MNKKRRGHLEITLALVLLAYGLGLMIGEAARDEAYGGGGHDDEREGDEKRGSAKRPDESGGSIPDCSCCRRNDRDSAVGSGEPSYRVCWLGS